MVLFLVDVCFVVAINCDFVMMMECGDFCGDFYYWLSVMMMELLLFCCYKYDNFEVMVCVFLE